MAKKFWSPKRRTVAVVLAAGLLAGAGYGAICGGARGASLDQDSRATPGEVDRLLKEDVDNTRKTCAFGEAPAWVTAKRARYGAGQRFADASDMCVAALGSIARDHRLPALYREMLAKLGGSIAGAGQLPQAIGGAVLKDVAKVPIGDGKVMTVTPALAFDAGFTAAVEENGRSKAENPDPEQLKSLAEGCLGQHQDAGACFSAGYMYGAESLSPPRASSR